MREFGSEHPAVVLPDGYFESFNRFGHCTWLRSGREALQLAGLNIRQEGEHPTILMPAYSCHSMTDPFIRLGWKVEYYPLLSDLTVDTVALTRLLKSIRPVAVLTMNFFGSASTANAVACVKIVCPGCACIEDFSHGTFALDVLFNPAVDFYVSSIRKSIGVCDGAVLIAKTPVDESFVLDEETAFVTIRREEQLNKYRYGYSANPSTKEEFLSRLREQEAELDDYEGIHRISGTGKAQLSCINGQEIRYARQVNMRHILNLLKGKVPSVSGIERCLGGAPFSFPILVEERDAVQDRLRRAGVYAPVLWPISDAARAVCPVSAEMADRMLSIPIDQRFNFADIEDISRIVLEKCS